METAILFAIHSEANVNKHYNWLKFADILCLTIPQNTDSTLTGPMANKHCLRNADKHAIGIPDLQAHMVNRTFYACKQRSHLGFFDYTKV